MMAISLQCARYSDDFKTADYIDVNCKPMFCKLLNPNNGLDLIMCLFTSFTSALFNYETLVHVAGWSASSVEPAAPTAH